MNCRSRVIGFGYANRSMRKSPANRPVKKRLTKSGLADRKAFAAREAHTRKILREQADRAIALRSKDREFHGLEREFIHHQDDLLRLFERAKDAKHPRDVGAAREGLLREFLVENGLLPGRYAISTTSVRACSTSGHISGELDLLIYDLLDSVSLMRRGCAYDVLPVESTFGTIQVKSKANRKELREGFDNIASYKRLKRIAGSSARMFTGRPQSETGFGILFAYDSDLDWEDIVSEACDFASTNPSDVWCNAIFILSKGMLLHGNGEAAFALNGDISTVHSVKIHGFPDRQGHCLYEFYSVLLKLLRNTMVLPPPIEKYFRLPFVAGEHSYEYSFGQFAEFATCKLHGDYSRKLTREQLSKVIEWCKAAEPINWIKAIDIAYGRSEDPTAYARQPGDVRIYNPDGLPLSEVLIMPYEGMEGGAKKLAFDSINTSGMQILIPYYYEARDGIINICPKCAAPKF